MSNTTNEPEIQEIKKLLNECETKMVTIINHYEEDNLFWKLKYIDLSKKLSSMVNSPQVTANVLVNICEEAKNVSELAREQINNSVS